MIVIVVSKKQFIFIHIPKTAGTAFSETYLDPLLESEFQTVSRDELPDEYGNWRHWQGSMHPTYEEFMACSGGYAELFETLTKVVIVRHPVARLKSAWYMYGHRDHDTPVDFVKNYKGHWSGPLLQYSYIEGASPLVVLKQENLENDCKKFCQQFDIPYQPLRKINARDQRDPQLNGPPITDQEEIEFAHVVREKYHKDFEFFGYE